MKIALGTVQFGLDYGVANESGRVNFDEAKTILKLSAENSIDTIDTAIAYGDSENTLGRIGLNNWKVVTKLSALPADCVDISGWVVSQIEGSLARLGIQQLYGVLLHRPEQLKEKAGRLIFNELENLKAKGLAKKIGISIYSPDELDTSMMAMEFDLVQAPLNLLDRRIIESGCASRLKERGIELHIRSVFLQGLLLMTTVQRPVKFSPWLPVWLEWHRWLSDTGLTPLQACLAYVLGIDEVDKVVIGVDNIRQLKEILDATKSTLPSLPNWELPLDQTLINPSLWSKL